MKYVDEFRDQKVAEKLAGGRSTGCESGCTDCEMRVGGNVLPFSAGLLRKPVTTVDERQTQETLMEQRSAFFLKLMMTAPVLLLGVITLDHLSEPRVRAQAEAARFDHVQIVSTAFIHKGQIGLLLLDRRNGNVWFAQKSTDESGRVPFEDPVFLFRAPLRSSTTRRKSAILNDSVLKGPPEVFVSGLEPARVVCLYVSAPAR